MRILILGGTGAIGAHLVETLKADVNNEIVVTSRQQRQSVSNVKYEVGNAHDMNFLTTLIKGGRHFDVIVDFMSYKTEEFRSLHSFFLEACEQYVFLSSARVYADKGLSPIHEDDPLLLDTIKDNKYLRTDEYALTKARQENILRNSNHNNYTIIRPYITYSEIRLQLGVLEKEFWLYRALHGRSIVFSDDIANNYTTLTYGKDVSLAICALLGKQDALGEAFHITGECAIKWKDVLEVYRQVIKNETGKEIEVVMTPRSSRLQYPEAKWQVVYDRCYNRCFDNSKMGRFIDINTFVKPEDGLKDCLTTFLKKPQFRDLSWKEEGIYDAITGEKASAAENPIWQYSLYRLIPRMILIDKMRQSLKIAIKG